MSEHHKIILPHDDSSDESAVILEFGPDGWRIEYPEDQPPRVLLSFGPGGWHVGFTWREFLRATWPLWAFVVFVFALALMG